MFWFNIAWFGWIAGLLLFVGAFFYLSWPQDRLKPLGIPGGPPRFWFQDLLSSRTPIPMWHVDLYLTQLYGKVTGYTVFGKRLYLVISDVEMAKEFFIKQADSFLDKPHLTGRGVLKHAITDLQGEEWRQVRHKISPYFSTGNMKMAIVPVNKVLDNLIKWLETKCEAKEMLDASHFCRLATIDMLCYSAYGLEVDSINNPDSELLTEAGKMLSALIVPNIWGTITFLLPFLGRLIEMLHIDVGSSRYMIEFTQKLIEQRRQSPEVNSHDFINVLLHQRGGKKTGLTDNEIISNAATILAAGFETTAIGLSFLFYNLITNPDWQEKLYKEIQDKVGEEVPDYEAVQSLHILDMCLNESLRLYPLAVRAERVCTKDTIIKGVRIPKGTTVVYPIWVMQRKPEIWNDPEKFDPERFLPEVKKDRDSMYYMPFGAGPRHCIGMRLAKIYIKLTAVRILQKFKLVKNSKTQIPLEIQPAYLVMRPKDGVWLSLEKRK